MDQYHNTFGQDDHYDNRHNTTQQYPTNYGGATDLYQDPAFNQFAQNAAQSAVAYHQE